MVEIAQQWWTTGCEVVSTGGGVVWCRSSRHTQHPQIRPYLPSLSWYSLWRTSWEGRSGRVCALEVSWSCRVVARVAALSFLMLPWISIST
ncbi:hypothetical protein E2C01_018406 [Portunus trituberculatus]|uniref:Uncharacterized protein n=1 Tax=Portunus trituberculatus TaxID=210409 RepID=A0A5B7DUZ3_PORTR|nr:hypothetical protein [Portunus trituberculatus]